MARFPQALRRYLLTVGIAGVVVLVGVWWFLFDVRSASPLVVVVLTGLLILFQATPQHKLPGAKLSLGTIPIFAAALCLPIHMAVSTVIVGMVVAEFIGHRPWFETLFNGACTGFEVGLGSLVYLIFSHEQSLGMTLVAITGAAVAMWLVNVSTVAGAISTQRGLSYLGVWRQMAQADARGRVLMCMAGGLLAGLLDWQWVWGTVLLVAGAFVYGATCLQWRSVFAHTISPTR